MKSTAPSSTLQDRPHSVTLIGWLFIAAGSVGLAYHLNEFRGQLHFNVALGWICFVRLIAIVGGVFMLRGRNWARWLVLAWMAYHVFLSAFHTPSAFLMHGVLLALIAYSLLRAPASGYFQSEGTKGRTGR